MVVNHSIFARVIISWFVVWWPYTLKSSFLPSLAWWERPSFGWFRILSSLQSKVSCINIGDTRDRDRITFGRKFKKKEFDFLVHHYKFINMGYCWRNHFIQFRCSAMHCFVCNLYRSFTLTKKAKKPLHMDSKMHGMPLYKILSGTNRY